MARQLVARLAAAEAAGAGCFALCVTGDHSTPVVFGDHSHEPVPLAVAHIRHGTLSRRAQMHRGSWHEWRHVIVLGDRACTRPCSRRCRTACTMLLKWEGNLSSTNNGELIIV